MRLQRDHRCHRCADRDTEIVELTQNRGPTTFWQSRTTNRSRPDQSVTSGAPSALISPTGPGSRLPKLYRKDHGRIPRCYAFDQLECLAEPEQWKGDRSASGKSTSR